MTSFIGESIHRGIDGRVQLNAEPAWATIRLNVAPRQPALASGRLSGSVPQDAYFVKCDAGTTTESDIDAGVANVAVGFAPLKPAEFVILTIRQLFEKRNPKAAARNPKAA